MTPFFFSRNQDDTATLVLSPFSRSAENLPISWSYLQISQMFMMSFMCRNSSAALKIPFVELIMKLLIFKRIYLIASILSVFLMKQKERLIVKPSSSSRSNGLITLNKKQPGNERINYDLNTLLSFLAFRNLGTRFL